MSETEQATPAPRIDAHHHFWNPARHHYPWMQGEALEPIRRTFEPQDFEPLLQEQSIDQSILVQTIASVDETREFLALAASHDYIAGVVGWLDLTASDIEADIEALRAGPGGDRLLGIRHQVHDEQDPDWLRRDDVQRGIRAVGEAGLVYDLLLRERELPAAIDCVDACASTRFVLDHIAKPRIAGGEMQPWLTDIRRLAEREQVYCKLSGMVTEADWASWRPPDLRPYVEASIDCFGESRVLFGSDWPVCLLAASYAEVVDALTATTADAGSEFNERLFGRNAIDAYRL